MKFTHLTWRHMAIGLFIFLSLVLIFFYFYVKKNSVILSQSKDTIQYLYDENILLLNIDNTSIESEDVRFNDLVLLNQELKYQTLKEVIGNDKFLILRSNETSCSVCEDSIIARVKRTFDEDDLNHFIILTSFNEARSFIFYSKMNKIKSKIYNIENDLALPIEDHKLPYLFICDSSLVSRSLFIPDKSLPKRTENFLKSIKNRNFLGKS